MDTDLPIRQAFHALHEQGTASAPLWDGREGGLVGVISASDFIHTLRRLRSAISSGHNPMSEAEMDAHTVRGGGRGGEVMGMKGWNGGGVMVMGTGFGRRRNEG